MIDLSGACAPTLCQISRLQAVLETDHPTLVRQLRHHFWTISHVFPSPIPTPRAPRVVLCVVPMRIDADWYWCLQSDGVFRFTSSGPGHPAAERRVPRAVQNVSFASALTPCAHTTPPLFGCVVSVLAFPASRIFARNDQKRRLTGGFL